jgi:DNA-binding NarL/FixJ family response regulator
MPGYNRRSGSTVCFSGRRVTAPIRLLIADDHEIVRKGRRAVLEARQGWVVAAEASDGREALQKAEEVVPHVTILDISMPSMNGLEAARQIRERVPETKILITHRNVVSFTCLNSTDLSAYATFLADASPQSIRTLAAKTHAASSLPFRFGTLINRILVLRHGQKGVSRMLPLSGAGTREAAKSQSDSAGQMGVSWISDIKT